MVHRRGRVLLLRRNNPPNKGKWALPGGLVELGETVQGAAVREILEETGLEVAIEGLLDVQSDMHADKHSKLEYHYVLVDYLAKPVGGRLRLDSESSGSGWFDARQIGALNMGDGTRRVLGIYFKQKRR